MSQLPPFARRSSVNLSGFTVTFNWKQVSALAVRGELELGDLPYAHSHHVEVTKDGRLPGGRFGWRSSNEVAPVFMSLISCLHHVELKHALEVIEKLSKVVEEQVASAGLCKTCHGTKRVTYPGNTGAQYNCPDCDKQTTGAVGHVP